jgi:hypothetical protein
VDEVDEAGENVGIGVGQDAVTPSGAEAEDREVVMSALRRSRHRRQPGPQRTLVGQWQRALLLRQHTPASQIPTIQQLGLLQRVGMERRSSRR